VRAVRRAVEVVVWKEGERKLSLDDATEQKKRGGSRRSSSTSAAEHPRKSSSASSSTFGAWAGGDVKSGGMLKWSLTRFGSEEKHVVVVSCSNGEGIRKMAHQCLGETKMDIRDAPYCRSSSCR